MATAGKTSGSVIQALCYLGQQHVVDKVVALLRRRIRDDIRKRMLKDLRYAPAWITSWMRKIAEPS